MFSHAEILDTVQEYFLVIKRMDRVHKNPDVLCQMR